MRAAPELRVEVAELHKALILGLCGGLGLLEECLGALGILLSKTGVAGFALDEGPVITGRLLGVEGEGIFATFFGGVAIKPLLK